MMSTELVVLSVVIVLGLAMASAFFSGMETALFSVNKLYLNRWRERDPETAARFERLMSKPRAVLSVILLTDTAVNIPLIVLCLALGNYLSTPIPNWLETLVLFGLIVVVCDLLPKLFALTDPFRFAHTAVAVLSTIMPAFAPISRAMEKFALRIADLFAREPADPNEPLGDEELMTLVELSAEEGELSDDEREMIEEIIKLGNKVAKDCMTPRIDAFTIPDALDNKEALRELRLRRHGRVPVYGESPDEILGVLDVKAFLLDPSRHYTEYLEPPSFVPETMPAIELLRSFLTHPQRLAIVLDEFGGTEGVVTFNDLVEEILGETGPRSDDSPYIEETGEGRWIASGSARLDDLSEATSVAIAHEGVDTVNGLLFNRLGYLPKPGARVEIAPFQFEIRQASRKRILEVMIERLERLKSKQA
ncbi:MAG: HlyC/CorC family transporter [Verrucomicrobia bacterium]|nr:HlyC/CorC family transporter [Verrucomicrobiota bacterium]